MEQNELKSIISNLSLVTELGIVVVVCLLIGLGLGLLVAKWTDQGPIFKILGVMLGLAAGIIQAYRLVVSKIK